MFVCIQRTAPGDQFLYPFTPVITDWLAGTSPVESEHHNSNNTGMVANALITVRWALHGWIVKSPNTWTEPLEVRTEVGVSTWDVRTQETPRTANFAEERTTTEPPCRNNIQLRKGLELTNSTCLSAVLLCPVL